VAHVRQSGPDSDLGFQSKIFFRNKMFPLYWVGITGTVWSRAGWSQAYRSRANVAHVRQLGPDSGRDFQLNVLKIFKFVPPRSMTEPCLPESLEAL